jgi:hypothetical protein
MINLKDRGLKLEKWVKWVAVSKFVQKNSLSSFYFPNDAFSVPKDL